MDVGGYGIVTDPVFGPRYSPLNGRRIPTPPADAYERTRLILVSHAHHDHLQPSTLRRFRRNSVILCPPPSEKYVRDLGPHVRVIRAGDEYRFPGGKILAVPAHHPGGRYSRKPRSDGGALGYVIVTPSITIYYSGDTEYFPGIERVAAEHRPDLAILNVNAHLPPIDALAATVALGVSRVLPSHVGAYGGRAARLAGALHDEYRRLAGAVAIPLRVGESVGLDQIERRPKPSVSERAGNAVEDSAREGGSGFPLLDRLLARARWGLIRLSEQVAP